jgi:hypothetical protein
MVIEEIEKQWRDLFAGKTLYGIRPQHESNTGVPAVDVTFTDASAFTIEVKDGVYFEGCLVNTLRKAQPVVDVLITEQDGDVMLEVQSKTFPLFVLMAQNKRLPVGEWPFTIKAKVVSDDSVAHA